MGTLCHKCPARMHDTPQGHSLGVPARENVCNCPQMAEVLVGHFNVCLSGHFIILIQLTNIMSFIYFNIKAVDTLGIALIAFQIG